MPKWFKQDILDESVTEKLRLLSQVKVNTVCSHARCPNLTDCFKSQQMTFMILGDVCTRGCLFCAVQENKKPVAVIDENEPRRIAKIIQSLGIKYAVITSVTRDDLADGGAGQYLRVITEIRNVGHNIKIEVLIPDFSGNLSFLRAVAEAAPSVLGHNIETVKRLHPELKPQSDYNTSLAVLKGVKNINPSLITKSSILLGLGETEVDVVEAMRDLLNARCDILVLGQYLAPSKAHYPVKEFISLEQFAKYRDIGIGLGFKAVLSSPKARSSYKAEEVYDSIIRMNEVAV